MTCTCDVSMVSPTINIQNIGSIKQQAAINLPYIIINVFDNNKERSIQTGCDNGLIANTFLTCPNFELNKNVTGKLSEEKKKRKKKKKSKQLNRMSCLSWPAIILVIDMAGNRATCTA